MRYFIFLTTLLFIMGCSKVNKDNYEQIRAGMQYSSVVEILGKPNACESAGNVNSCVWGNVSKNIKIRFVNERVAQASSLGM